MSDNEVVKLAKSSGDELRKLLGTKPKRQLLKPKSTGGVTIPFRLAKISGGKLSGYSTLEGKPAMTVTVDLDKGTITTWYAS